MHATFQKKLGGFVNALKYFVTDQKVVFKPIQVILWQMDYFK